MASDLQFELDEAFRELEQLQQDTKDLLASSKTAKKKRNAPKVAHSTWAKSTVRRIDFPDQRSVKSGQTDGDFTPPTSTPNSLRPQSAPAFSFPKSSRSTLVTADTSPAPQYDPNINILSTKHRSRAAIIPPPPAPSAPLIAPSHASDDALTVTTITSNTTPAKAFSFGKAPRVVETPPEPSSTITPLNVEQGEKYLYTHVPTAIMRPPPEPRVAPESPNTTLESQSPVTNVEVLSKHIRTPAVSMAPKSVKQSKRNTSPGPGTYNPVPVKETIQKGVKFTPVRQRSDNEFVTAKRKPTPGPGEYHPEAADNVTVTHAPTARIIAPTKTTTPHLERKRYFEEKVRDLREEHDDGRDANVDVVKPRSHAVKIINKTVGITDKNREILLLKRLESERAKQLQYDAKYDLVEKRPRIGVKMEEEVRTKQSIEKLRRKPGVADALAQKAAPQLDFLGPQLQAPWISETAADSDSPTDDILKLLGDKEHLDTTNAYLRSSFVGTIASKPAVIKMAPPKPNEERLLAERKLTWEEMQQQYLSTQVHQPWENNKSDGKWSTYGRDERRIHRKGEEEVIRFNESVVPNREAMGPGYYEFGGKFGDDARGVSFGEAVGRDLDEESLGLDKEEICISPLQAKDKIDKRPKAVKLYANERHPKPKKVDDAFADHLGGSYFEGMAESIDKQRAVVNFDAMTGRAENEEPLEDVVSEELQLEVNNWKPHKEREGRDVVFPDPKRNPRFVEVKRDEKPPDAPPTPIPNYDYKRKHEPQVDMSRQLGRAENEAKESNIIEEEIGEHVTAVELRNIASEAKDIDDRLKKGEMQQSGKKRMHAPVDMSRHTKDPPPMKSAAPDVVYEVKSDFVKNRQGKGVVAWSLQAEEDDMNAIVDEIGPDDELAVSPIPENKSSYKRTISGPAWSRDAASTRTEVPSPPEEELDLEPNLDYLKPGIAAPKRGVAMHRQGGRLNPTLQDVGIADSSEELILKPDLDLRHPKPTHGAAWSKASESVPSMRIDDQKSGDILILEKPTDNWQVTGRRGFGSSRHNYESRIERQMGDNEELILEPQVRESTQNHQMSWKNEHSISHPSYLSQEEELILSPNIPELQKTRSWAKNGEAIDRSSVLSRPEELILSQPPAPAVMKGSWSKNDDTVAGISILTKPEELILSPQPLKRKQPAPASWKQQNDQDIDRHSTLPQQEEVKLSIVESKPRKKVISWEKQRDGVSDRRSMLPESEVLDLTPQEKAVTRNKDSVVRWSTQDADVAEGSVIPQSQVLKLSPKVAKRSGDRTVAWKQDTKKPSKESQVKHAHSISSSAAKRKPLKRTEESGTMSVSSRSNLTATKRISSKKPAAPDSLSPIATTVSAPSPTSRAPRTPIDDDIDALDAKLRELELLK